MEISENKILNYNFKSNDKTSANNNQTNNTPTENKLPTPTAENCRAYIMPIKCDNIDKKEVITGMDKEFVDIRDRFCKELEPKHLKQYISDWEFYINSTNENKEKSEKDSEEVFALYRDEKLYKKLLNLKEKGLKDTHLNKQLNDLTREFDEELFEDYGRLLGPISEEYKRVTRENLNLFNFFGYVELYKKFTVIYSKNYHLTYYL